MRDYDPTTGRYLQADPLGLIDGASVYGYALQNPGRYTDPTGEFIPVVVGVLLGSVVNWAFDGLYAYCGCTSVDAKIRDVPFIWEAYGAFAGGFGGFEPKGRKGIGGGGRSCDWTSTWSKYFGASKRNPSGAARRAWGRYAAKRIPYVGAVLAGYEAARLGSCLYEKWRSP